MRASSIRVISVIIKLRNRVIFRLIFSLYMKVSGIGVISVIIKPQIGVISRSIFSLNMMVSGIRVISVIIKLQESIIFRLIFSLNMKYPCNQCDYQATRQCSLRRHITAKHYSILKCDYCDYF